MITSGKEIFLSISKKLINSQGKYLINNQYIIIKEQGFEWKKVANIYLVRHSILAWNNAFCYPKLANNKPDVAIEKNGEFLFQYIGVIHMYLGIKSSLRSAVKMMEYWLYSKNHENPIHGTRFDCGQFGLYERDDQRRNIMTFPEFYMMYILDEDKVQARNPFEESLIEVQDEWSGHGNIVEASGREQSDLIKRESYPGINQFCFGNTLRQNGAYSAIQCQHDLRLMRGSEKPLYVGK